MKVSARIDIFMCVHRKYTRIVVTNVWAADPKGGHGVIAVGSVAPSTN